MLFRSRADQALAQWLESDTLLAKQFRDAQAQANPVHGKQLHTFNILALQQMGQHTNLFEGEILFGKNVAWWAFVLLFIGFVIKVPSVPFHTWLPDAHVQAPTPISMILAGVLLKMGGYGIIRICYSICPSAGYELAYVVCLVGVVSMVYGAFAALAQKDFKRMVAYSSVSHMGYVLMGLATMNAVGVNGAVLQMFSHGVMTALMFAMVGSLYDQAHTREIAAFGGLVKRMPHFVALFAIAGLASLGLPGLSGFVAEFNIFLGVFRTYPALGALGILGAAITAVYVLRMMSQAFFGPENEKWLELKDMSRYEYAGGAVLLAFIVLMGIYPSPFVDRIAETVLKIPGVA